MARTSSLARADSRRLRYVERHPGSATTGDVARLLRAEGLAEEVVRFTVAKVRRLDITAFTAWMWVKRFDAVSLSVVAGADLGQAELLGHLAEGRLPHLDGFRVLAELNGLPTGSAAAVPVARRGAAGGRGLVVHEPGSWPYGGWVSTPATPGHK